MVYSMGLISDRSGTYVPREDGTRDYGTMTSAKINGQELYNFDQEKGVLQISMSPEDLEILGKQIGEIPKTGKDLILPTPYGLDGHARFKGVKSIETMPDVKEGEYLMVLEEVKPKKGLLRNLFSRCS